MVEPNARDDRIVGGSGLPCDELPEQKPLLARCGSRNLYVRRIDHVSVLRECFNLVRLGQQGITISYAVGIAFAVVFLFVFMFRIYLNPKRSLELQNKTIIGRK